MWPILRSRRVKGWFGALAALVAAVPAHASPPEPTTAARPSEELALAVTVNGTPVPEAIVVRRQGDTVWMAASDLRALGVPMPANPPPQVALQSIPGLAFTIDDAEQTMALTFGPSGRQRLRATGISAPDDTPITPSGWGGMLNYDLSATYRAKRTAIGGFLDGVVYGPGGYAFASAIVSTERTDVSRRVQRLDTGVTFANPGAMRRITVGDYINRSLSFTRPVRMVGVQFTTDFALRPDLVTFPVPAIDAQAAVPSAVDLIVNGSRQAAGDVKAGSFAVTDVPVQTGLNTISVAVRDATGRERLQTVTTYASTALLAPGLNSFAFEAGFVRTGYGTPFDRYRDPAVSGGWRRGISDWLTLETHGEASKKLANGGIGAVVSLDRFGLFSASIAGSRGAGSTGGQFTASWERIARPISVTARFTANTARWSDLASRNGSVTRTHTGILNISFDIGKKGSLSGSLIELGRGRVTPLDTNGRPGPERRVAASRFAVGTYSVRLGLRFSVMASAGGDLRRARSFYASAGLLLTFGSRTSGYAGGLIRSGGQSARADVTRSALVAGDLGYTASVSSGDIDRVAGGVEYLGNAGRYEVQAERVDRAVAVRASARGAVVVADGSVFASDRLTDSFAVVDTSGQRDVAIYRDNRRIGTTNARGKLLVANLRPYEKTKIGFEPDQLPLDAATEDSEMVVKPPERAGVRVPFRIFRNSAMALRLVTANGLPFPPGTRVAINDTNDLPVGFDGAVYVLTTRATNILTARLPDGAVCTARFTRPPDYAANSPPLPVMCRVASVAER